MNRIYVSLVFVAISQITFAQTESRLFERVFIFSNGNLLNASPEQCSLSADTAVSNFSYGARNLVHFNGKFYHVFSSMVDGDYDVYLRKSTDGLNWSQPVQVNDDSAGATQNLASLVVSDAGGGNSNMVVAWRDNRNTWYQMRSAISTDGGQTFSSSVVIDGNTASQSSLGSIARDAGGNLYAVWNYFDGCWNHIDLSKSFDGGNTWSTPVSAFSGGCFADLVLVQARNAGEVSLLISIDQFNLKNIIALSSSDSGSTWQQSPVTNYSSFQEICYYMSGDVTGNGSLQTVFTHEINGSNPKILSASSPDWGITWTDTSRVSDNVPLLQVWQYQGQFQPSLTSDHDGNLFAAWGDARNDLPHDQNFDVYLSHSEDGGATWSSNLLVPQDTAPHNQGFASVCASKNLSGNDTVLVVWTSNFPSMTAVAELPQQNFFSVSPNPFTQYATIHYSGNGIAAFSLYNIFGQEVLREENISNGQILEREAFPAGLYFYRVHERAGTTAAGKIIME